MLKWKEISKNAKITIIVELICGIGLIILGIIAKEALAILMGIYSLIEILDVYNAEIKNKLLKMFEVLCDVQQELLAEKCSCSRQEVDEMCTEVLEKRNEEMRKKINGESL